MMLPELHLADWRATKDTLHLLQPNPRQDPAGDHGTAQPLVECPAVRGRAGPDDAPPGPSRWRFAVAGEQFRPPAAAISRPLGWQTRTSHHCFWRPAGPAYSPLATCAAAGQARRSRHW